MSKKISATDEASSIGANDYLAGVYINGATKLNKRYPFALLAGGLKKMITIDGANLTGNNLMDSFFSNTITEIVTDGQAYLAGVHFTQSGTTITGTLITFTAGQVLLAKV
jgi:hypothetical protein